MKPADTRLQLGKNLFRTHGAFYFGEYEKAQHCHDNVKMLGNMDIVCTITVVVFGQLIASALYRCTKRRKYKKEALKYLTKMRKLVKEKGPTKVNKFLLMEADFLSTFDESVDSMSVKRSFERAISTSKRSGLMQDAALASELCGSYFLSRGDSDWAAYYYTAAASIYRDWGATAKVAHLVQNLGKHVQLKEKARMKTSRKDRRWLIEKVAEASSDFTAEFAPIELGSSSLRSGGVLELASWH